MPQLLRLLALLATHGKRALALLSQVDAARRLLPKEQREALEGWARRFVSARTAKSRLAVLDEALTRCEEMAETPEEKQQAADWRRSHQSISASIQASRALPAAARVRSRRRINGRILGLTTEVVEYAMTGALPAVTSGGSEDRAPDVGGNGDLS